jgi:hypothetical protein
METSDRKTFEVDGAEVTLVRDARGVHWECSACHGHCEHQLKAAVWMTLESWGLDREHAGLLN